MRFLLSPYRLPTHHQVYLNEDEMASWLNAIIALWHPAIIWGTDAPPRVDSAYEHEQPKPGHVYVLPDSPPQFLPDDWSDRVRNVGALKFPAHTTREATLEAFKECLREAATLEESRPFFDKPEITRLLELTEEQLAPFFGLAFGYLMIDSLFEAMDHEKLLDYPGFWGDIQQSIRAILDNGDSESIDIPLREAAGKLLRAREILYSVNIHLLDIWDLREFNLNQHPPAGFVRSNPLNIMMTGRTAERLAAEQPALLAEIKTRLDEAIQPPVLEVIGGLYREREDAVLPVESQLWNMRHGRQRTKDLLSAQVEVLGRRQSAGSPQTPSFVQLTGYRRAMLTPFDGAITPTYRSTIVNWTSPDGKSIDAFTRVPASAAKAETFFNFVHTLHQSISQDSAPTLSLIHDGSHAQPFHADWMALSKLGPVLGEWTTFSRYFSDALAGEYVGVANADDFFTDYLEQRVEARRADVVSGFVRMTRDRRQMDAGLTFAAINRVMSAVPFADEQAKRLDELHAMEILRENTGVDGIVAEEFPAIADAGRFWAGQLAGRLQARAAENQPGYLLLNPCMFTRRVAVELDRTNGNIAVADPLKAVQIDADKTRCVVEVPPLGFAWIPSAGNASAPKQRIRMADGNTVRNEFFEAELDPLTGGIRNIRDAKLKMPRLAMQIVYNPGSRTECKGIEITHNGAALGEIVSRGVILNEANEQLATFTLRLRAWLTRPLLDIRLELNVSHSPTGYPWHSYYGARFAWRDERSALLRGVNGATMRTDHTRPMSPDFIDVRLGRSGTTIFGGGLPFNQRQGTRMLDVILRPECEETAVFDLGVGIDREYPMQTALGYVSPVEVIPTTKGPPHIGPSGWLFHVDSPNILMLSMRPSGDGKRAFIATFQETSGIHGGSALLRCVRDPVHATLIDGDDNPTSGLTITGDAVQLDFAGGELFRVRVDFE